MATAETRPHAALTFNDLRLASSIILSAFFYFFDFATNIHTAVTYYHIEYKWHAYRPGKISGGFLIGMFMVVVWIMVSAHIGSAVVFAFSVETKREAMKAAFLLPVIHLRRLALLLWRKGSLRGVSGIASEELSSVYNVLAAAMEAAPQIFFQLNVLKSIIEHDGLRLAKGLVISIVASFLSVIYNCSQATALAMRRTNFKARVFMGVISGLYSSSALVVRYVGVATLMEFRFNAESIYAVVIMCSIYVCANMGVPTLTYCRELAGDGRAASLTKRLLVSIALAYMSALIGPLFVLLSLSTNHHPPNRRSRSYQGKLLALSLVYILPDVFLFILFLFKMFQDAQIADHAIMDRNTSAETLQDIYKYLRHRPCVGDKLNTFCRVWTIILFECAVAVHVVSIFLVIVFEKCWKKQDHHDDDKSLSYRESELVKENEIRGLGTEEARISISRKEKNNAFVCNMAQGCML